MPANIRNEFKQGRLNHLLFRSKLRAILLDADIDEAPVLSEHDCPFGQWMQTFLLRACAHLPELKELEKIHTEMHRKARNVVRKHHAGADVTNSADMTSLEKLDDQIMELLDRLEAHM